MTKKTWTIQSNLIDPNLGLFINIIIWKERIGGGGGAKDMQWFKALQEHEQQNNRQNSVKYNKGPQFSSKAKQVNGGWNPGLTIQNIS